MGEWKLIILELLRDHPGGLTINDITNRINISRHTVSVALAELRGQGKVAVRSVGMAKLHYTKEE